MEVAREALLLGLDGELLDPLVRVFASSMLAAISGLSANISAPTFSAADAHVEKASADALVEVEA